MALVDRTTVAGHKRAFGSLAKAGLRAQRGLFGKYRVNNHMDPHGQARRPAELLARARTPLHRVDSPGTMQLYLAIFR